MWVVMRCDYSAVLHIDGDYLWRSKHNAQRAATAWEGHVVKWKVAKKILTINRMIGRKD